MALHPITAEYERIAIWLKPHLSPWRKLTIAIDGVDGSGKSSLARFLSWQTGIPVIETDLALLENNEVPTYDLRLLSRLITTRHKNSRPAIVEGVVILQTLHAIGINPELLIRVRQNGHDGCFGWRNAYQKYACEYPRSRQPDCELSWSAI